MRDSFERLTKNIGKLKRNETQMTPEQKERYKKPLLKLKQEIAKNGQEVMRDIITNGIRFSEHDAEGWKDVIRRIEGLIEEWSSSGKMKEASNALFISCDINRFLTALLPLHYKIWYEAYGPYWISHCTPTFEDEFTYQNDIIGMEWWEEHDEWAFVKMECGRKVVDYQKGVTVMLPPTQELLERAYKEDMEGLT